MIKTLGYLALVASTFGLVANAEAATTVYYGDDDGFGRGATSGSLDATASSATAGEDPFTDIRLIGDAFPGLPAFKPTGSFGTFTAGTVTSAILTLRMGSFSPNSPVNGVNYLYLNGLLVDPSFLNSFTANPSGGNDFIETRSIALNSSFFASLGTGNVSLAGTDISEGSGYGSFQVDFLRLDVESVAAVPEPSTWALMLLGFGFVGGALRSTKRREKLSVSFA